MPAATSTKINMVTRGAWGSLAHSCHRDRVGVSARTLSHSLPQSPVERRDVAVPMEPECLAREGARKGGVPPHPASLLMLIICASIDSQGAGAMPATASALTLSVPRETFLLEHG